MKSLQNALPEERQFLECIYIMSLYLNMLSKEWDNISPFSMLLKWIQFGAKLLSLNQYFLLLVSSWIPGQVKQAVDISAAWYCYFCSFIFIGAKIRSQERIKHHFTRTYPNKSNVFSPKNILFYLYCLYFILSAWRPIEVSGTIYRIKISNLM